MGSFIEEHWPAWVITTRHSESKPAWTCLIPIMYLWGVAGEFLKITYSLRNFAIKYLQSHSQVLIWLYYFVLNLNLCRELNISNELIDLSLLFSICLHVFEHTSQGNIRKQSLRSVAETGLHKFRHSSARLLSPYNLHHTPRSIKPCYWCPGLIDV